MQLWLLFPKLHINRLAANFVHLLFGTFCLKERAVGSQVVGGLASNTYILNSSSQVSRSSDR